MANSKLFTKLTVFPGLGLALTGLRTIVRNCAVGTTFEIDVGSSSVTLSAI
jgi:hypothetical protein